MIQTVEYARCGGRGLQVASRMPRRRGLALRTAPHRSTSPRHAGGAPCLVVDSQGLLDLANLQQNQFLRLGRRPGLCQFGCQLGPPLLIRIPAHHRLAFLPLYLWIATDNPLFRSPLLVGPWLVVIAFLMISNVATLGWSAMRPRRSVRLELIALVGLVIAALLTEPWLTLSGICIVYLLLIPVGVVRYAKVKRQRAASVRNEPLPPA